MSAKIILVFCAQALLIQSALSQCTSPAAVVASPGIPATAPYGLAAPGLYNGLAAPYGLAGVGLGYNGLAGAYGFGAGLAYDGLAPYGLGARYGGLMGYNGIIDTIPAIAPGCGCGRGYGYVI